MSDDMRPDMRASNTRIDTADPWDLFLWSRTLGISKSQLEVVIQSVGPSLDDVRRHIEDNRLGD